MDRKAKKDPLESKLQDIIKKKSDENIALKKLLKNLESSNDSDKEINKSKNTK